MFSLFGAAGQTREEFYYIKIMLIMLKIMIILECGGILEGMTGTLRSPGYPNGYPHAHICQWIIKAERVSQI